jgi:hypothetical protein
VSTLIGTSKILISVTKMIVMITVFVVNFLILVVRMVEGGGGGMTVMKIKHQIH